MLKRFISYYRPHKLIFTLDMLASLLVALVGIVYPIITREMLNELIPNKQYRMIVFAGIGLLLLYIVRMLLNFFIQYYGHVMGVRMQAQMRSDMFRHLEKLPYSFYDNHETGKIMSRMTSDLMDISELAHHGPENLLISSISVVISFIYLSTINIWLTLIIFACVPFLIPHALTQDRGDEDEEGDAGDDDEGQPDIDGGQVDKGDHHRNGGDEQILGTVVSQLADVHEIAGHAGHDLTRLVVVIEGKG